MRKQKNKNLGGKRLKNLKNSVKRIQTLLVAMTSINYCGISNKVPLEFIPLTSILMATRFMAMK